MARLTNRADIQGMRAVAVLLVAFSHAGLAGVPGGYIGVDVFFVLSGYLISSLLLKEASDTGRLSLVNFYARRARRILPAATLTLVATTVLATLTLSFVRADQIVKDVLWSTFFAANIHFGRQGTDYFSSELPPSPVQHYWSLAVEEQFYLVWPLLLALILVLTVRRSGDKARLEKVQRRLPVLTVVAVVICAASLWWSVVDTASSPTGAYFSTAARAWELGAGVLLALSSRWMSRVRGLPALALGLLGIALIGYAAVTFSARTPFPGYHALLPVVGTVCLLVAGASSQGHGVSRLLSMQPLRWLGDVSYSFYLWHWPLLVLGAAWAGHPLSLVSNLALLSVALGLSALSYHFVENPIRRARLLSHRPRASLLLWPAALAAVLVTSAWSGAHTADVEASLAAASHHVDLSQLPKNERVPRTDDALHNEIADAVDKATLAAPIPFPLAQDLTKLHSDLWDRGDACTAQPNDASSQICPAGDTSGSRTVVLLGDSHANMWLPALDKLGKANGTRIMPIIKFGCTPDNVPMFRKDMGGIYSTCTTWRAWALRQIASIHPDAVIVGSETEFAMLGPNGAGLKPAQQLTAWRSGVHSLAQQLGALTPDVVFLSDITYLPGNPAECLSATGATMASCTFNVNPRTTLMNKIMAQGLQGTSAHYFDVEPLLCADMRCPEVVGNIVVYRDRDHVTVTYQLHLAADLNRRLGGLI